MRSSFFTSAILSATQAFALTRSPQPTVTNGQYVVGGYSYANRAIFDFAGRTTLPDGLYASTWPIGDTHKFDASNVVVGGGYLNLKVPGGQAAKPYSCAEVSTTFDNIKYASVRTVAIFSEPAGVCNGIFFYESDTQETDIEWLSDKASLSNQGTRQVWLTNQDADGNGVKTYNTTLPPANPTTTEHEYRLDWTPGRVRWFVDGVEKFTTTSDVPSVAGPWVFNNWSNGDKGWSAGPPASQADFKIKDVYMYYNTA
ncbi:concanavalin A-like lectin/glucanase [Colletotrichum zoysiae]|uniref:Concanavalin A-like lectin/glucanase n=1 Tax=Colletotrichum zoysiae TaxID=1216348 RepID=A0AAD9HEU5_9PEZI|nr:concanavalin A-like lectin/glucanase [Colletotrichum zoysiae]